MSITDRHLNGIDPILIPPTLTGKHGRAWLCNLDSIRRRKKIKEDEDGTVAMWMVEVPWATPLWHSCGIIMVHLRPHKRFKDIHIYVDGATHEFWVCPIVFGPPRHLMIHRGEFIWQKPITFAAQFIAESDDAACERIQRTVTEMVEGRLSPDYAQRFKWESMYGIAMVTEQGKA